MNTNTNPGAVAGLAHLYEPCISESGERGWQLNMSKCTPIAKGRALDAAPRAMDHRRRMHAALDRMLNRKRPRHPVEDAEADMQELIRLLRSCDTDLVGGIEKGVGAGLGAAGEGARLGGEAGEAALGLLADDDDDDDDPDVKVARMAAPFMAIEDDDPDDDDESTAAAILPLAIAADRKKPRRKLRSRDSQLEHCIDLNARYRAAHGKMAPETGTRPSGPENLSQHLDEAHAARRSQSRGFDSKAPATDLEYFERQALLSGPAFIPGGR